MLTQKKKGVCKVKKRIVTGCVICAVVLGSIGLAFAADPGSDGDPLISKSYIDSVVLPQIYSYIDSAVAGLKPSVGTVQTDKFEVVNVGAGKQVIAGAGTELILRMGSGSIIGSARGGIADTTDGTDLQNGSAIPANHLLIVPLGDGRGMQISSGGDAIVMIKGSYEIK